MVTTMPCKILIVEDEALIALDIEQILTEVGYDVVAVANSAKEALEAVIRFEPHLVLMDIQLGGDMDGVDAAILIRSKFNLPVVFVAASIDTLPAERFNTVKDCGYVCKPFHEEDLVSGVSGAIAKHCP